MHSGTNELAVKIGVEDLVDRFICHTYCEVHFNLSWIVRRSGNEACLKCPSGNLIECLCEEDGHCDLSVCLTVCVCMVVSKEVLVCVNDTLMVSLRPIRDRWKAQEEVPTVFKADCGRMLHKSFILLVSDFTLLMRNGSLFCSVCIWRYLAFQLDGPEKFENST